MGWLTITDPKTGATEFLGDVPAGDSIPPDVSDRMTRVKIMQRLATKEQIEKTFPGTFGGGLNIFPSLKGGDFR